eukprot:scaffold659965_cov32-Prasinocladus_malaysianus.AAC.1
MLVVYYCRQYPPSVQSLIRGMPHKPARELSELYPGADPDALRLASAMLDLDPDGRPSAAQVLSDPVFDDLWQGAESASSPSTASEHDFAFSDHKRSMTFDQLRQLMYREVLHYHPNKREKRKLGEGFDNYGLNESFQHQQVKIEVRRTMPAAVRVLQPELNTSQR